MNITAGQLHREWEAWGKALGNKECRISFMDDELDKIEQLPGSIHSLKENGIEYEVTFKSGDTMRVSAYFALDVAMLERKSTTAAPTPAGSRDPAGGEGDAIHNEEALKIAQGEKDYANLHSAALWHEAYGKLEAENARLQAELERLTRKLEFLKDSSDALLEAEQECTRQHRDNFMMLYKAVSSKAPDMWSEVKPNIIDTSHEIDKLSSAVTRYQQEKMLHDHTQAALAASEQRVRELEAKNAALKTSDVISQATIERLEHQLGNIHRSLANAVGVHHVDYRIDTLIDAVSKAFHQGNVYARKWINQQPKEIEED